MVDFFKSIEATMALFVIASLIFGWFSVRLLHTVWAEKENRLPLGVIVLLGLGLRIAWIQFALPEPVSDFQVYWQYALNFLKGNMVFDTINRHPGPPILLAFAAKLFGTGLEAAWILNLTLAALMIISVFAFAKPLLGQRMALLAALLTALMPQLITYTALTASESISVPTAMVFVWAMQDAWRRNDFSILTWILLGVALYFNILLRSTAVLYVGVLALLILLMERHRWQTCAKAFATMSLTACLLVSGWIYHQYLVTEGGTKLFWGMELGLACAVQYDKDGNYLNGGFMSPTQYSFYPKVRQYFEIPNRTPVQEAKAIEMVGKEVYPIILNDPMRYMLNGFPRMKHVLNSAHTGIYWSGQKSPRLDSHSKLARRLGTVSTVFWQIILYVSPLSLLWYFRRDRSTHDALWALNFIMLYLGIWFVFHMLLGLSSERYNLQVMPFVIMLFPAAVSTVLQLFHRKPNPMSLSPALE